MKNNLPFHIQILASLGIVKIKPITKPDKVIIDEVKTGQTRKVKIPSGWIVPLIILGIGVVLTFGVLPNMVNKNHVTPDNTVYTESSVFAENLKKEALPFEEMYTNRQLSQALKNDLQRQKTLIDRASCSTLLDYYNTNSGWMSRPYMAYKLLDLHCV